MEVVGRGQKITLAAAPRIAIPTTAGTGAEETRNAEIGLSDKKFKASIRSELLLPRIALVDPELGVEISPEVTARSGMDALCQLIESYTSSGATPITDGLAIKGIALAAKALPRAFHDGQDLAARTDMALAALLSGITLTNAGLGAVHGFAAPLGANFPAPHGAICAALLAPVISANIAALLLQRQDPARTRTLARYAEIGRLLADRPELNGATACQYAIWKIEAMVQELAIGTLSRFGLSAGDIPAMVELAKKASSMRFNPVTLSDESLAAALAVAIG
jgi:alcohol dehydrogenase class IV